MKLEEKLKYHDQEFEALLTIFDKNFYFFEGTRGLIIEWANKQRIDDQQKRIKNGDDLYQFLFEETRKAYIKYRIEGFEREKSLDKAIEILVPWIEKASKKMENQTIYLNYSPAFYHRLRHLNED